MCQVVTATAEESLKDAPPESSNFVIVEQETKTEGQHNAKNSASSNRETATPETNCEQQRIPWPEDSLHPHNNNIIFRVYQAWTYSYFSPLLAKGSRQLHRNDGGERLSEQDLFAVPESMKSDSLSLQFRELFYGPMGNRKLFRTLWHMIRHIYIPAGLCMLITVICQSTNPLLVRALLNLLEDHPSEQIAQQGLPFAVAIFLVLLLNGLANHRHRFLAMKSGILMRTALVNVIYQHVLHLTPKGRTGLTSGEVSTLLAVDTQKVFEASQEGHLLWSLPLSVSLITLFLVLVLGPVTLVGIAVLVGFLPVASYATAKMLAIRQQRVKKTDERVGIVNMMLQGIKVAKLNNYEDNYLQKISHVRNQELVLLRREIAVWATTLTITVVGPLLATAATFSIYVLANEDNILTASKTFSVLLLFAALRFPISYAARFLGKAAQALSALERIAFFLQREALYEDVSLSDGDSIHANKALIGTEISPLVLENASFCHGFVNPTDDSKSEQEVVTGAWFEVSMFDLSVKKGEVLAVCGPVGSGKSTMIGGIISEVAHATPETKVVINGKVGYVPQTPFILNATFRENILFGLPFEPKRYERVLDSCCLRADIEQLGDGQDLTQIGERGVTLSGGQKQRVALARAAYCSPDIVLLDDPLSALDAGTSKVVFDRLIKGDNSYFENTAVVLVTHASHFLNMVDRIVIVVDGGNKFVGTWSDLALFEPVDENTKRTIDHIKSSVQEDVDHTDDEIDKPVGESTGTTDGKQVRGIMTIEEREIGLSSLKTWLLWFKYAGGAYFLSIAIFILAMDRVLYVSVEYWVARWTSGAEESINVFGKTFAPQSDGRSAQFDYLKVLATLVSASVIATNLRSTWVVTGGSRAAKKVSAAMLERVLKAPMSFFETTPMGRVLNRFTYDIEVIDVILTQAMSILMMAVSWFVAGVMVTSAVLPYMVVALVPVIGVYLLILLHYRKSAVDLQRLDAVSRSPVQAMLSEVLDGSSSIRVFGRQGIFVKRFQLAVDTNTSAMLNYVTAQRWLGVRIESLGASMVLVASALVVSFNDVLGIEPGLVGLLILWSANFTIFLGVVIDFFGEAEAAITAIERVDAMTRIPNEKSMKTEDALMPPSEWPQRGHLTFDNVCLRYRPGLPLALNNLTFSVSPGQTCGVVGRTGAGKSSLTVALFRLVEIESGRIMLDGQDLGTLGLSDVRGRPNGMGIIPQDPFLTGTNLRYVVDPFLQHSDADVLDALRAVRMAGVSDTVAKLETRVEEGGSNFSVGERQLLNLARALLSKPKVLVLDEATASVDGETDAFIQQMLRTRFKGTTLLTIAHRLHTVMDYDIILVMANGRAAEIGSPSELLSANGMFAELVDATGPESARALRQLASKPKIS